MRLTRIPPLINFECYPCCHHELLSYCVTVVGLTPHRHAVVVRQMRLAAIFPARRIKPNPLRPRSATLYTTTSQNLRAFYHKIAPASSATFVAIFTVCGRNSHAYIRCSLGVLATDAGTISACRPLVQASGFSSLPRRSRLWIVTREVVQM